MDTWLTFGGRLPDAQDVGTCRKLTVTACKTTHWCSKFIDMIFDCLVIQGWSRHTRGGQLFEAPFEDLPLDVSLRQVALQLALWAQRDSLSPVQALDISAAMR